MNDRMYKLLESAMIIGSIIFAGYTFLTNLPEPEHKPMPISYSYEQEYEYDDTDFEDYVYVPLSTDHIIREIELELRIRYGYVRIVKSDIYENMYNIQVVHPNIDNAVSGTRVINIQEYNNVVLDLQKICKICKEYFDEKGVNYPVYASLVNEPLAKTAFIMTTEDSLKFSIYE